MSSAIASFSSPAAVVWEYFLSLRLIVQSARSADSPQLARQQAALALIMSVTAVEVYLNLWFRVRVEESTNPADRASLAHDLAARKSIDFKLKQWPKRYLGRELNMRKGPGKAFAEVKSKRNAIVHFATSHETVELGSDYRLHGMANTTEYDALGANEANVALTAATECVLEIFRLAGMTPPEVDSAMHAWTGMVAT